MKKLLISFALLVGMALGQGYESIPKEYQPLVATVSNIPFTFDLGSTSLFTDEVGLLVGVAVYPVPIFLDGEVNVDVTADVTYRSGVAPFYFLMSAGPRYSYVESSWLPGRGEAGSYAGAGATAGLEIDLNLLGVDIINILLEAGADYSFGLTESSSPTQLTVRTGVGISLPLAGLSTTY